MDRLELGGAERERLLALYRSDRDPLLRLRAHIILLPGDGHTWAMIAAVLYCSTATIAKWKGRFEAGGVGALTEDGRGRPPTLWRCWSEVVVGWVKHRTPLDFGITRSRWCCRTVVVLMLQLCQVKVSDETVRRWLHKRGMVWRRPRPVVGRRDRHRKARLDEIRRLLRALPADEAAVFQDEVDIDLNPRIGCMWMARGRQAKVRTPGDNAKRYLAGSLNWRTGSLIATQGPRRNGELFLAHLEELRRRLRRYRRVHVICDNASFHKSRAVRKYLDRHGDRVVLHHLPRYDPQSNPIERVWWKMHEAVTRNHRCESVEELVDLVFRWLEETGRVEVEDQIYFPRKKRAA